MKLYGLCDWCKKVKRVNVSGSGMVAIVRGGVPTGVCDDCLDAEERRAR